MSILVPGWSRADYLLEYSINSNIFFYSYTLWDLCSKQNEKKVGIKKVSLVKYFNILDIIITAKTGPGSKMIDRVWYYIGCLIKITKGHKNLFIHF